MESSGTVLGGKIRAVREAWACHYAPGGLRKDEKGRRKKFS